MNATTQQLNGVYHNGHIHLEGTPDWPEGTTVVVKLAEKTEEADTPITMMREEDWPTTPEGVEAILARWNEREALEFTPEGEVERAAWRAEMKRFNIEAVRKQWGLPE